MVLWNTCKNQLLIFFYYLQFGVDSIYGQNNALYIKFVPCGSSLEESSVGGRHAHLSRKNYPRGIVNFRLCIRENVATTVLKIRVVNKDKTL